MKEALFFVTPGRNYSISSGGNLEFWGSDGGRGDNQYYWKTTAAQSASCRTNYLPWPHAGAPTRFFVPNTPRGIDVAHKTAKFPLLQQNTTPEAGTGYTFVSQ